ncbi:hypothetical protein BIW11_07595 [Tropilaelaps mercedesae]|uniref:Uncharacterized protein n=1 Tax=Tropilaelaps mercedesae TaxID=418985 RepID=A0A1V9XTC6_9ACAR|nr:hypothetical protein BIW11_07595 [Tropilaelaps mercedesae]
MSGSTSSRILELLRQLEFPGSANFNERDIEIFAQDRKVGDFFEKIANMEPNLFLNKEEARVIQLAAEMNDPAFAPIDACAVREQLALIERKRRRDKVLQMRLRQKREERRQLKEAISLLEADANYRSELCDRKKKEMLANERLHRTADDTLTKAHHRVQNATAMVRKIPFLLQGQSHLKKMTHVIDTLKQSDGLRNIIDKANYVTLANGIVDSLETLHGIVSRPDPDPEYHVVRLGSNGSVYLARTLRDASEKVNEYCSQTLSIVERLDGSSPTFGRFEKALRSYQQALQDTIEEIINDLFQSTWTASKRRLERLGPVITSLEAVVWAQRCFFTEEIAFLRSCSEMLRAGEEWAAALVGALPGIENANKTSTMTNRTFSNTTHMNDTSYYGTLSQSPLLSSTMLETSSCAMAGPQHLSITSGIGAGANLSQMWRIPHVVIQIEDSLNAMARYCNAFHKVCEAMQSDRRILRGRLGIEVISDAGQKQLERVTFETEKKRASIKILLSQQDQLVKVTNSM